MLGQPGFVVAGAVDGAHGLVEYLGQQPLAEAATQAA